MRKESVMGMMAPKEYYGEKSMIRLFEAYPKLGEALPFIPLGTYPTPINDAFGLDTKGRSAGVYIKNDGVSCARYGGNKVRKLEFLLAQAQHEGHSHVLTFGGAGSNHALATAIYAQGLGLRPISMLIAQPNAHAVRRNLLRSIATGVELHHFNSLATISLGTFMRANRHLLRAGRWPMLIPPGGTSPLGLLGFVNAAFELKAQADAGVLPMPDVVYVAAGSMGSCVGLALGFRLLGAGTKVIAPRVADERYVSQEKGAKLFAQALGILRSAEASVPECVLDWDKLVLRQDFYGGEYGRYTEAGVAAVREMAGCAHLKLEGCYTGKCAAAMLHDLRKGDLDGKCVLFWNTYNAHDFSKEIEGADYRELPKAFHRYFEEGVQELDAG